MLRFPTKILATACLAANAVPSRAFLAQAPSFVLGLRTPAICRAAQFRTRVVMASARDEEEYVQHISNSLNGKLAHILGGNMKYGDIIQPKLHDFFWVRTVDAMQWILECGAGEMAFDQTIEDEIPILCKYFNEFIGEDAWSEQDHAMMMVLNKYDKFKAAGYGNFAQFKE